VLDHVPSHDMRRVAAETATDEFLHQLWAQLGAQPEAAIAHRHLVASNILVDAEGLPWIVDFAHAVSSPRQHAFDNDVAELLVSTSHLVGPGRAVEAAVHSLGGGPVGNALSELAPFSLTPEARRQLHGSDRLEQLRAAVAERTTSATPRLGQPPAQSAWHIGVGTLLVVGTVAALVVIAGAGDVIDSLLDARARWLGVAIVAMSVAGLAGAASLAAAIDRRLAIGQAVAIRAVARGAALAAGRSGATAVTVDQLARSGVPPDDSAAAIARVRLASWIGWAAVTAVALVEAFDDGHGLVRPDHVAALATVAVVAAAGHVVLELLATRRSPDDAGGVPPPSHRDRPDPPGAQFLLPALVATLVEIAAGALGSIAAVTAFDAAVPASQVALVHLAGWALVHLLPVSAPAARPAIIAIGLAASGAPLPVAVAVASLLATIEWSGHVMGFARGRDRRGRRFV
jgi:hypothetical protein